MRDWPGKVLIAGAVALVLGFAIRGGIGFLLVLVAAALLLFGAIGLMIRRGAFTPRR